MIRISALNESTSDESESISEATTKEAKEAEAFGWYNRALVLQKQGNIFDAESTLQHIIDHPFLLEATELVENEVDGAVHPGLPLLYSVHKNLAGIAANRKDEKTALHHYLEAVKVDESEVTVWYKIGKIALKIHNYSLAKLAFEQGLVCNANHWPCLDEIITITYAYNNYWNCLEFIAKALEKDCSYMKAIAIREQMFKEQPDLKPLAKQLFIYCDPIIFRTKVGKEEADEYINEAVAIKNKRRELAKLPPLPVTKLSEKIDKFTWQRVGECFLALYKMAMNPDEPTSLCRKVDLSEYKDIMEQSMETDDAKCVENEGDTAIPSGESKLDTSTAAADAKETVNGDKDENICLDSPVQSKSNSTLEQKGEKIESVEHSSCVNNPIQDSEKAKDSSDIKSDLDASTTESSQESENEGVYQSSSESLNGLESELDTSRKSADTAATDSPVSSQATTVSMATTSAPDSQISSQASTVSMATTSPSPARSQTTNVTIAITSTSEIQSSSQPSTMSIATSSVSERQTSSQTTTMSKVTMTASDFLPQVAVKVIADTSSPVAEPNSSVAKVTSIIDQRQNSPANLPDDQSGVVEVFGYEQTESSAEAVTKSILPSFEAVGSDAATASNVQIEGTLQNGRQPSGNSKPSILDSMIVGDFLPAEDIGPDFDYETLFKDHNEAKSITPTSRNDPNRGQKRKRLYLDDRYGNKRRSARVKNTKEQKQEENVNFQELLQKFLPSSLVQNTDDEDEEIRSDEAETDKEQSTEQNKKENNVKSDTVILLKVNEEVEIKKFILSCIKNTGIIHLCSKYLKTLAHQDYKKWPEGLTRTFLDLLQETRPNLTFPDLFSTYQSIETKYDFSKVGLVGCELLLDYYTQHHTSLDTEILSSEKMKDVFGKYLKDDLWYILFCIGFPTILKQNSTSYCIRVHWLRGRYYLLQGNIEEAVVCFDQTIFFLNELEEKEQKSFVQLQNCQTDELITADKIKSTKENVERTHSLDQVQKQYENEDYDKVINSLLKAFENSVDMTPVWCISPPERHSQIQLLQKALFKQGNMQKCVFWGEVCFNKALHYYRKAPTPIHREEWVKTMTDVLDFLNKALEKDTSASKDLPSANKIRFSQNLMKVLETMMDVSMNVVDMPIGTVIPWIVLYRIIHYEEVKLHSMIASQSEGQAEVLEGAISSSLMLLSVAHEYLGRHSWCTKNNGAVLLLFLKVLRKERRKSKLSSNLREELDVALEQCVYCLYGHPNKKTKSRRLQDHNSPPISLTWIRAQPVFEYFKPSTVPEFDSYKTSTVSAELEGLLRRVFVLVPEELGSVARIDSVLKYIEGEVHTPPTYETDNSVLKELYYLLADYYFKNKETSKATRFYQYDLCVNPTRLDSWAGTALSRMSQLEQKLNAMELKLDTPLHKKSIATLRCFKRAVEINDSTRTLWIEYGSLAYQLHSHSSRQLKLKSWFPLDEELRHIVMETKPEMLQIARNCYWKASECEADGNEEEWLHHYMMGKVKEKKGAHPKDYLEHYRQAAIYLHEDEAMYPKRIVFSHSPPHLAIEALEVFYRLHAAILKNLLRDDGIHDYPLYQHYITEAEASPFAKGREKRQERRESTTEDSSSSNSAYSQSKQKPVYHMTPQDHTYSKRKGLSSESDTDTTSCSVTEHILLSTPDLNKNGTKVNENTDKPSQLIKRVTEPFVSSIEMTSATGVPEVTNVANQVAVHVKDSVEMMDTGEPNNEKLSAKPQFILGEQNNSSVKTESSTSTTSITHSENNSENTPTKDESIIDLTVNDEDVTDCKTKDNNTSDGNKIDTADSLQNKQNPEQSKVDSSEKMDQDTPIIIDSSSDGGKIKDNMSESKPAEPHKDVTVKDKPIKDSETIHKELVEKCMNTLQMCSSRFPNHYKSVYRLSHAYATSKHHKNLQFARDILLGKSHWQQSDHMSTPGLFHERKRANFFQGIWKIPVEEIDRSGSFASHMNRSMCLLLYILKSLEDNRMLYNIHVQLLRVPDTGKKFLRDPERIYLWKQAFRYTIDVLMIRCESLSSENDEEKRMPFLMDVYKVWHHGINKLNKFVESTNKVFIKTFLLALRDKVDDSQPILEQASKFCQHRQNLLSAGLPQIPGQKPISVSKSQDSQSDSSLFSPTKSDNQSEFFSPPPKTSLSQSSCMFPVPNSPSTPSITSSKYLSSPSTSESSIARATPKSSKVLTSFPVTSMTPGYLASSIVYKKSETRMLTPATSKIFSPCVNKPESTKPIQNILSSVSVSNPVPKKAGTSTSYVTPKQTVSKITVAKAPTQNINAAKSVAMTATKMATAPKMSQISSSSSVMKQSSAQPPRNPMHVKRPNNGNSSNQQKKQNVEAHFSGTSSLPSADSKKVTHGQAKSKAPSGEVVETLIEAHDEDDLLIMSNPDELIQSFLGYHNL